MGSEMCIRDSLKRTSTSNGWRHHHRQSSSTQRSSTTLLEFALFRSDRRHQSGRTLTWTVYRPAPVSITSRFVRVAQENLSNWNNQRIFDGSVHILAKYERNATGESLNWIPASVIIPLNQTSNEANPICLLYTSPSPRDLSTSRMPSSA